MESKRKGNIKTVDFKVNDKVLVLDYGNWRPAVLVKHKPYCHRLGKFEGFDVSFLNNKKTCPVSGIVPSQGGWFPVNSIKKDK